MQGRVALRALVGDGRARARLEVEVDVPALLVDVLDHLTERLFVERLAPRADVVCRRLAARYRQRSASPPWYLERAYLRAFFTSFGAVFTRTKTRT